MRRDAPALALALLVALGACGAGESATARDGSGGGSRGGGGPPGRGGDQATPVEVAPVGLGSMAREAAVSGMLEPLRTVGVNAQLPGALVSVRVEEGDRVRPGQVLAEVDAREIAAQVRSAEATHALARSTAERSEQLFREKIVTTAEYERDQAALASARATLDQLRTRLGYATIRAPMAGVIIERRVERGDIVQAQARLFTVADVSTLVVRVHASELDVAGISAGDDVDVTVDALGGQAVRGVVRRVFPAADTVTRMVPVEVALSGPEVGRVKPGFMARVRFQLGQRANILLVPSTAVVGTQDQRAVFVVQGGRAERRPVRLGQVSGPHVEVLEGVSAGETVVVAGADNLRDGAAVRAVRPVGSPEGETMRPAAPRATDGAGRDGARVPR